MTIRFRVFSCASETNSAVDHIFGYTGRERDTESDLQYNRARYYDADAGRWISEDPIGFSAGDTNLARYVSNSPTNATDPSGMYQETVENPNPDLVTEGKDVIRRRPTKKWTTDFELPWIIDGSVTGIPDESALVIRADVLIAGTVDFGLRSPISSPALARGKLKLNPKVFDDLVPEIYESITTDKRLLEPRGENYFSIHPDFANFMHELSPKRRKPGSIEALINTDAHQGRLLWDSVVGGVTGYTIDKAKDKLLFDFSEDDPDEYRVNYPIRNIVRNVIGGIRVDEDTIVLRTGGEFYAGDEIEPDTTITRYNVRWEYDRDTRQHRVILVFEKSY